MNDVYNGNMVKRRMTITIEPKVYSRLQSLAKQSNRSMSNMIETLVMSAYNNRDSLKDKVIRTDLDQMDFKPKY